MPVIVGVILALIFIVAFSGWFFHLASGWNQFVLDDIYFKFNENLSEENIKKVFEPILKIDIYQVYLDNYFKDSLDPKVLKEIYEQKKYEFL